MNGDATIMLVTILSVLLEMFREFMKKRNDNVKVANPRIALMKRYLPLKVVICKYLKYRAVHWSELSPIRMSSNR
jgi:hypothetical protein